MVGRSSFKSRPFANLLLSLFLFVSFAHARLASLFSSSVTYCSPPESLLIQEFQVQYFKHNASVVFDITASSLLPNLNVTAQIVLNAYGLRPINLTFNLCEVSKALCPLPLYNFSGSATLPLPDVQGHIPGIAYIVPDLEAAAQLTLTRIEDNKVVGCVQTTLSNGWSLRQGGVSWGVGALAIFAFFLSVWKTTSETLSVSSEPQSPLVYRFITLLFLCQHIVSSSFLYLNYPVAFRSYALNFAWAFGLFASSEDSHLQRSIDSLRNKTGGHDAGSALKPVDFVNRRLSPYNEVDTNLRARSLHWLSGRFTKREFITPATVTASEADVLPAGIPLYTNSIGIATGNAFMSMFFTALILIAAIIVLAILSFGIIWAVDRARTKAGHLWRIKHDFWTIVCKTVIRVAVITVIPAFTLAFFQWTLGDSWLAVLLSVILIIFIGSILGYTAFLLVKTCRNNTTAFTSPAHKMHYLTAHTEAYTQSRWFFTIYVVLPLALAKAVFTSFPKSTALAQVSGFIVVELTFFGLLIAFRPFATKGGQALEIFLSIIRLVTSGMLIAFVESVKVKPIPRAAVAFIAAVLYSAAILVLFVNVLLNLWPRAWCCGRSRKGQSGDAQNTRNSSDTLSRPMVGMMEKGQDSTLAAPRLDRVSEVPSARYEAVSYQASSTSKLYPPSLHAPSPHSHPASPTSDRTFSSQGYGPPEYRSGQAPSPPPKESRAQSSAFGSTPSPSPHLAVPRHFSLASTVPSDSAYGRSSTPGEPFDRSEWPPSWDPTRDTKSSYPPTPPAPFGTLRGNSDLSYLSRR